MLLPAVVSLIVSAVVAFPVALYSADRADESRRAADKREALATVYVPLSQAASEVLSCVRPEGCTDAQLFSSRRRFRRAQLEAIIRGSSEVQAAVSSFEQSLAPVVMERLADRVPSDTMLRTVAEDFSRLLRSISSELGMVGS